MEILISGACGFVGSHLARHLMESHEGVAIVGLDNLARSGSETNRVSLKHLGVQLFHGDIRMASDLETLPPADWFVDAVAQPSVLAVRLRSGQLLNVSGGQVNSMSLAQLTARCDQRFGPHQIIADGSERPYDVPWLILDFSKALTATAWKPHITLPQILEEIADHTAANPNWFTWCGA
jgi:nucleoside-diphosphate-sugar epimerase